MNLLNSLISKIDFINKRFKSFIFLIFIIFLLYNIGFISYMEENIDCFEECSLKEEDESILLKEINELKNLKIEDFNSEEKNENNLLDKDCNLSMLQKINFCINYIIFFILLKIVMPFFEVIPKKYCLQHFIMYIYHLYVYEKKSISYIIILLMLKKILFLFFCIGGMC